MSDRTRVALVLAAAAPFASGCRAERGALMLAVSTDMSAPKDVNAVGITIYTDDTLRHDVIGRVTPEGDVLLPATLAVAEPEHTDAIVRLRVMAFQETKARVLRDVRTTVPHGGRVALLRVPLSFVDDGSVTGTLPPGVLPPSATGTGAGSAGLDGETAEYDSTIFAPNCPDPLQTWIDGACADATVDSSALPDYDDTLVQGAGGASACFEVATCFASSAPLDAQVGPESCSIPARDTTSLNLALVTRDTGACDERGNCFVPLDMGDHGWQADGDRIALARGVCAKLRAGATLYAASAPCPTKTPSQPLCSGAAPSVADQGAATAP